jgi:HlyD family secretion protein
MRLFIKLVLVVLVLAGAAAAAYRPLSKWQKERNRPNWREEAVVKGSIVATVNSTGTIKPVMSVQVGSFVSGPIDDSVPLAEFNQEVEKGDPLAKIDPRIYEANRLRDKAIVRTREADVMRVEALLGQATNDLARAKS